MRLNKRIYDALIKVLLVLLYFIPYGFMAMLADMRNGTMAGYLLAGLLMSMLAFFSRITNHRLFALGGLLLSSLTSLSMVVRYAEQWSMYTKPLTPAGVLMVVMAVMLGLHILIWKLIDKFKKET